MKLYAFASEDAVFCGGDPHAVVIELSRDDAIELERADENRHAARHEIGRYVLVTDQATGRRFHVASAPCGAGCHCAAVALEIKEG